MAQLKLGSGKLYITAYTGSDIPANATLEVEANELGIIKGGASLEYKPTEYEAFSDDYRVHKRFVISEEVSFKAGVIDWNAETLSKITAVGEYEDDTVNKVRTLTIGTQGATEMTKYVLRYVHVVGEEFFRITIVATASNGFSLAFAADKETIVEPEFKAIAHGANGTKVIFEETYQ